MPSGIMADTLVKSRGKLPENKYIRNSYLLFI
jgi:hypothetical protein